VDEVRAPLKAKRTKKTELKKSQAELDAKEPSIRRFVKALQTGMKGYLGEENPEIVKFGFKLDKKQRKLTSEESQKRAEKSRRTRERNHTMGSQQKKRFDDSADAEPSNGTQTGAANGASHVA